MTPDDLLGLVPKGRGKNLELRRHLLKRAADPEVRAALVEACRRSVVFYVNCFVWTYDPRTKSKSLPFVTYPFQDEALLEIGRAVEDQADLVIEKSRDMGASWLSLVLMEHRWHFHPGYTFLMISRKEDLVDKPGDPDSLFWKVDFVHRHLPAWLLPKGYEPAKHRRRCHFENPETGSTIDGESTTSAAGVGGRRTAIFIDEFSRIEEGYALLAGTADVTGCRIFNFTPYGTSNAAYKLARRPDVRKLRMHWSAHPQKAAGLYRFDDKAARVEVLDKAYRFPADFDFVMDGRLRSPWYDGECKRRANDREVAQMLDIDYAGSAYQFFDKTLILDLQKTYCCPPYWEGDVSFDPDTAFPHALVPAAGGPLKLWCLPDAHGRPPAAPYAAGGDLCSGQGATNSVVSIINAATGEKVAEYASPFLKPDQFATRAVALCRLFASAAGDTAYFCWEMQGPGVAFGKRVIELGYRNVYFRSNEQSLGMKVTDQPGWYPSPDNRRVVLEEYRSALSTRRLTNRSHMAMEECLGYIHTAKGTIEAAGVSDTADPTGARANHGDRVIADALAWKMAEATAAPAVRREEERPEVGTLAWRRKLVGRQSSAAGDLLW